VRVAQDAEQDGEQSDRWLGVREHQRVGRDAGQTTRPAGDDRQGDLRHDRAVLAVGSPRPVEQSRGHTDAVGAK
jgi:hypothetical protein